MNERADVDGAEFRFLQFVYAEPETDEVVIRTLRKSIAFRCGYIDGRTIKFFCDFFGNGEARFEILVV